MFLKKKTESGYIGLYSGYIPLSLGTDISSNKSDFSICIHTHAHPDRHSHTHKPFLTVKSFYSYLHNREVLGLNDFKRCT